MFESIAIDHALNPVAVSRVQDLRVRSKAKKDRSPASAKDTKSPDGNAEPGRRNRRRGETPRRETEIGGPKGPEPTRYGDWERKGIVSDF